MPTTHFEQAPLQTRDVRSPDDGGYAFAAPDALASRLAGLVVVALPMRRPYVLVPLLAALSLAARGGGGSGPPPTAPADGDPDAPSGPPDPDTTPPETNAPPDFVVSDLVLSPRTTEDRLSVSVSIANVGEGAGTVPDTWFLVSTSPDLSSGYAPHLASLGATAGGNRVLESGEEGTFEVSSDFRGGIKLDLERSGTHYARLWLNPDLSSNFSNPEDSVVASHAVVESDYVNNLSAIVEFERAPREGVPPGEECEPDELEENDSLDAAALIALDTEYVINPCDDWLDVLAVELASGQAVEIVFDDGSIWYRTVIAPDGTYVVRNVATDTTIVQAEMDGLYRIAFQPNSFFVNGLRDHTVSVNSLR